MSTPFEDIYRKYAEDVFRFALWLCGNRADAEEIAAEVFLRLWTLREEIRTPTVKSYLLIIAKNLHTSRLRRRRKTDPIDEAVIADTRPTGSQLAELNDDMDDLMKRIQLLPLGEREALLLRVQQELSFEEIAICLEISLSAAKVRVHRARLKLL